jgi:hypothetical protein
MSAYICNPEHLGLLAALLAIEKREGGEAAADHASVLASENIRSVSYRYPNDQSGQRPGQSLYDNEVISTARLWATHYFESPPKIKPVELFSLCNCYEYQSCETNDWRSTRAAELIDSLRGYMIRKLPGYEDAPWEWRDNTYPKCVRQFNLWIGSGIEPTQN